MPFHGRVVAAASGHPIAGATVRRDLDGDATRTDDEGRFQLSVGAAPGAYSVSLTGFRARRFEADREHRTPEHAASFELARIATLEVAVYDERTRPLAGAEILIRSGKRGAVARGPLIGHAGDEWRGVTDERGRYRFASLPVNRALYATILYEGRTLREIAWPLLLDGEDRISVGWLVDRGRERVGVVRDVKGQVLAGVRLWLLRNDDGPFERRRPRHLAEHGARDTAIARVPLREIVTDEHGAFRLPALPHGWYRIGPAPGGMHLPLAVPLEHDLRDDPRRIDLELEGGVIITGKVLAADGEGIASALVFAEQAGVAGVLSTRCDAQGRFALGPVPDASLRLLARDERFGFETPVLDLPAGSREVTLQL